MMKIFLDDIRVIDKDLGYLVARSYEECVGYISAFRNMLDVVSLDYSLGTEKTGLDVVIYMHENKFYPNHLNIHSDHHEGVPMMEAYVMKHFPKEVNLTINPNR